MEKYLHRCLDSLLVSDENMQRLEVLVINDGSKDSSSAIAHKYKDKYPQTFRVIDKENGNYGSCINRGLKEAIGRYIKVLDADDFFDNKEFDKFISDINNINADLILSNFAFVDENGDEISRKKIDLPYNRYLNRQDIDQLETICTMQMHGVTYSLSLFRDGSYHQSEGISYTDQEWIFTPMFRVNTVYVVNQYLYKYLIGREGQTMDSKVMVRNISHTVLGLYKMIDDYGKMYFSNDSDKYYFKYRLRQRMRYIYLNYLITNYKLLDDSEIFAIDEEIKNKNLEIYDLAFNITIAKIFFFVKIWRKNSNSLQLQILRFIIKCIGLLPRGIANRIIR